MIKLRNAIILTVTFAILIAIGYGLYLLERNGMDVWFIVLITYFVINSFFLLALFSQHRHPSAKLSWFIAMTVLPFFAHVLFFVFGRRYPGRVSQNVYLKNREFKQENLKQNKKIKITHKGLFQRQSNMSHRGAYDGDFEFMPNGTKAFREMFKDMRSAKKFISIHYYIIHPGEIYDEFKSILIKKAGEGVEVRLIVDDFGRWAMPWYEIKELEEKGVHVKVFGKVSFPFIGAENGYRTHRKCVIVDGELVHAGGLNIGDEYANLSKKYGKWVDQQFRIKGQAVKSYNLLFIQDWRITTGEVMDIDRYELSKPGGKSQSILVEDGPHIKEDILGKSFISWILHAKKEIQISSPYFIPTSAILSALITALKSGVKVIIYIPGKADKVSVLKATQYWAKELQDQGAEIRDVNDMFIHSKIGLFDGEYAYAGTANVDMRSLFSQFEFVNLIAGPAVKGVEDIFNHYKEMSEVLKPEELQTNRLRDRFIRILVQLMSPLM